MPLYHPFLSFKKVVRLPEYEYIGLTEIELEIIDTFEFQRLRRIKQTPGAYMVYPGAAHTRFEHSLGVMHLAGEATVYALLNTYLSMSVKDGRPKPIYKINICDLNKFTENFLKKYKLEFSDKKEFEDIVQKIRLAGLLHDIGHGPFSHTFELFHELCNRDWSHEDVGKEIIKHLLQNSVYSPAEIINILQGKCKFLSDILVSDAYNFDRMNYLVLDSRRAGTIEYGIIDVSRVIQNLYIDDKGQLRIGKKAKDAALRTLEAYILMYHNVYLHKKARGTDIQIAHILKYAQLNDGLNLLEPDVEELLNLWDDGVILHIYVNAKNSTTKDILKRFLKRDILKCIASWQAGSEPRILRQKGIEGASEFIKEKASLNREKLVYVDITDIKPPAPIPSSSDVFKEITFYDPKEGDIKWSETDFRRLVSLLNRVREFRIYCFKDDASRVQGVLKDYFKKDKMEEITL